MRISIITFTARRLTVPVVLILMGFIIYTSACAQDILFLGGLTHEGKLADTTYAWVVEYTDDISQHSSITLAWHNEGHLRDHHRDGPAIQFWRHFSLTDDRLTLSLGVGPYLYFDTAQAETGVTYANDHGAGLIYSAGISWYIDKPWFFHLRINRIETDTPYDTTILLAGAAYEFAIPSAIHAPLTKALLEQEPFRNEINIFLGRTILNSFASEYSTAATLEYRRNVGNQLEWTVGWLHEGAHRIIRRNGATSQIWLLREVLAKRLTLGIGAGAYLVINKEHLVNNGSDDDERISGILTPTVSYRFRNQWLTRLSWNRIITGYNRDTDVIQLGIGYRY